MEFDTAVIGHSHAQFSLDPAKPVRMKVYKKGLQTPGETPFQVFYVQYMKLRGLGRD
jgi:hypothetical protein